MLGRCYLGLYLTLWLVSSVCSQSKDYFWLEKYDFLNSIACTVKTPEGFVRHKVEVGSYADWLRHLPLVNGQDSVFLFNGKPVTSHNANYAVVDIDIGSRGLLQCADAIIRLRAEYLFSKGAYDEIKFTLTSGDTAFYSKWREGFRPIVKGNVVSWYKFGGLDSSYESFREYLDSVFMYAGTYSLAKELKDVKSVDSIEIGDAFILGGFPGHAVLVADVAENHQNRQKLMLLIQGYTPAQDIHIIKNELRKDGLPWFETKPGDILEILHWKFTESHIRRF